MVEEGMREEESEVVNAYNLIRDFVKRDNQEEGQQSADVRCREVLLKVREITLCLYVDGNYPIWRRKSPEQNP